MQAPSSDSLLSNVLLLERCAGSGHPRWRYEQDLCGSPGKPFGHRPVVTKGTFISDELKRQRKILVVDDEPAIAEPFQIGLKGDGRLVRSATSGKEAIEIIESFEPDLLVTDIIMPEVDILDVIAEFRLVRPQMKIIAMSGNLHLLRLAARNGADHILPKPFRIGELNSLIKKLLNEK